MTYFYDTNALLRLGEKCFQQFFLISSITLEELENIKVSRNKDESIKAKARQVVRLLNENDNSYKAIVYNDTIKGIVASFGLEETPDIKICACAKWAHDEFTNPNSPVHDIVFVTDDLCCKQFAKYFFLMETENVSGDNDIDYLGYQIISVNDEQLASVYSDSRNNIFNAITNEYIIMKDKDGNFVDTVKWTNSGYISIVKKNYSFESKQFGKIKPFDEIQRCAFDSINNNVITMLYGRAGSGKTTIPLAYAEAMMDKGKYKQIVFVYSYDPLKGARELGFERGEHIDKLINYGAIGNILGSKYGDLDSIGIQIERQRINIIPTANIRGVDFKDCIIIVTEAQNLDVYTLKTIIQRCEDNCKLILDGDCLEQTDTNSDASGMKRFVEVFKGTQYAGIVKLAKNYRSSFGELADKM